MLDEITKSLVKYRLEQAGECLQSCERSYNDGSLKASLNRSYYAIFHSMRAMLALESFDSKKHSGIISAFRQRFIKTKKFSSQFSDAINDAFEIRNEADYQDFYIASESETRRQLENAKEFHAAVTEFISNFISEAEGENGASD